MFVLNVYFCCELRFVATYAPNSDFYSEIQELTQILLRISEEKFGGWSLWSGQVSNEVLSFYILQYMFRLLSSIWEMCKNMYFAITWNSNTTEINWFDSDFAQTIWAKICWVGALLCTFIIFQSVHQRPALCPPPTSDLVSTSEPPVSHKLRNSKTKAQASFRTSESSTSLQLPNLQDNK